MSVPLVILGLLSERPCHGYELRQEVERRLYASYINLSGGSLYYNLGQLEQSGYVEKSKVERKGRYPARQVYRITSDGQDYLRDELRRLLFDTRERDKMFDPLNTALAFGHFLDESELRDAIGSHLLWARKRLAWISDQQTYWSTEKTTLAQSKIIEHGLAHFQAEIAWLEQFLAELEKPNGRAALPNRAVATSVAAASEDVQPVEET